ncbi:hypothetical protein U9M48_022396 [Paspalum notatum var. saurae]|uniref:RING-type domain-containing protein n=1 Tax=Paspalum notatum var. saurae TaxID=547442 RepID=A0AAQ3TI58_PASNO
MGFPLVCYCVTVPKPVVAFCKLLCAIRDAVLLMLALVGLCHFTPQDGGERGSADGPRPEEVKSRLPAMEYAQLLERETSAAAAHDHDGAGAACIVCLESVEAADEVRRLGNCAHAFHRGCIDRWIDLGRATCPLCRSDLLPRPRARPGPLRMVMGRLAGLLATRVW